MPMRKCSHCLQEKELSEFPYSNKAKGTRQTICKACLREYGAAYRTRHVDDRLAKLRQYYAENRERLLAQKAEYSATHKDEIRAKNEAWYQANREKARAYSRQYYWDHPEDRKEKRHQYGQRVKLEAFNAYGGPRCACCGETITAFLSIDHINGVTADQRKKEGLGTGFYCWLKKNNYPPGFQVLCFNCNLGRAINGGICPHKSPSP